MTSSEKVAYIKGLMDGLELDESSKETKVIKAIVDVLEDLALSVADVEDEVAVIDDDLSELYDIVDELEDDLDDLYEDYYEDEDGEDDYDDDYPFFDEDEDEDDGLFEVKCAKCGSNVVVDGEKLYDGDAVCPLCGEPIELPDFDSDDNEDE